MGGVDSGRAEGKPWPLVARVTEHESGVGERTRRTVEVSENFAQNWKCHAMPNFGHALPLLFQHVSSTTNVLELGHHGYCARGVRVLPDWMQCGLRFLPVRTPTVLTLSSLKLAGTITPCLPCRACFRGGLGLTAGVVVPAGLLIAAATCSTYQGTCMASCAVMAGIAEVAAAAAAATAATAAVGGAAVAVSGALGGAAVVAGGAAAGVSGVAAAAGGAAAAAGGATAIFAGITLLPVVAVVGGVVGGAMYFIRK